MPLPIMTLEVSDWFRSAGVLVIAFVTVSVVTFGIAALIVPSAAGSSGVSPGAGASGEAAPSAVAGPTTTVGGTMTVSGDREGSFVLDRESIDGRYALEGDQGRIFFDGDPLTVPQISWDGLEFFLDPDECTITPGERHDPTGVAGAHLRCEDIADVRDNGVVTMEGTLGVASNLLGLRGDLPPPGGTVEVGDETLEFEAAFMTVATFSSFAGLLETADGSGRLTLSYDAMTHSLTLDEITIDGEVSVVPAGTCALSTRDIGAVNAHTTLVEVMIRCEAVEVSGLGTVLVSGTVLVDQVDPPF